MNERPFVDKSGKPTEAAVRSALGSVYACYKKVVDLAGAYSREWTFTKSGGWMLKIYDRKKALLYLIPLNERFKISLTMRENERAAFLRDDELGRMHAKIASSKKYPEGFALQVEVAGKDDFQSLEGFLGKLIAMRA